MCNQLKNARNPSPSLTGRAGVGLFITMKKETLKRILDIAITILTAIVTALTTTSCMGHGPF